MLLEREASSAGIARTNLVLQSPGPEDTQGRHRGHTGQLTWYKWVFLVMVNATRRHAQHLSHMNAQACASWGYMNAQAWPSWGYLDEWTILHTIEHHKAPPLEALYANLHPWYTWGASRGTHGTPHPPAATPEACNHVPHTAATLMPTHRCHPHAALLCRIPLPQGKV